MKPSTTALRDQIVAALREAKGFPLSTNQVEEAVGTRFGGVYRQLAALQRKGSVGCDHLPGYRRVYWRLIYCRVVCSFCGRGTAAVKGLSGPCGCCGAMVFGGQE
jgi:hypothetical protein